MVPISSLERNPSAAASVSKGQQSEDGTPDDTSTRSTTTGFCRVSDESGSFVQQQTSASTAASSISSGLSEKVHSSSGAQSNLKAKSHQMKTKSSARRDSLPSNDAWDSTNWDLNAQQPHGGQEWSTLGEKFVEDFSVTTNFMGPPWKAVSAAASSLQHVDHYPAANFEPAVTDLATFLDPTNRFPDLHDRLMLGNGASELIDLVTRIAAPEGAFTLRSDVQYKEYERAAKADGRALIVDSGDGSIATTHSSGNSLAGNSSGDEVPMKVAEKSLKETAKPGWSMLAVINPCNPTGDYMPIDELKSYIERSVEANNSAATRRQQASCVLVDESMQLWRGEDWRADSLVTQDSWVKEMQEKNQCSVFLIHSWTKIWSCPGIRLGSILCPTTRDAMRLKCHQVPWSLNICALAFLSSAVADKEYLRQTWELTLAWRKRTEMKLKEMFPHWIVYGEKWLSWLWIDTQTSQQAAAAVRVAKAAGVPIRNGAMGYNQSTFIRIAVRSPDKQDVLFHALSLIPQLPEDEITKRRKQKCSN